ncbi:hypothetical protein ABZ924_30505 [Streptomyces sp. NPDC046876]|uniref:hypothetical protein n=1 Tax=Streptomyces sp. NPDC046876 TaxID=3155616 RepID=UPI0033EB11E7
MADPPSPGGRQRPFLGRSMRVVGALMIGSGCLLVLVAASRMRGTSFAMNSPGRAQNPWLWTFLSLHLVTFTTLSGGLLLLLAGRWLARHGRRHTTRVLRSAAQLEDRRFVLYLRPFYGDRVTVQQSSAFGEGHSSLSTVMSAGLQEPRSMTLEEGIVRSFRRFGRVAAVGQPGESLPLPGADKLYLPLNDWKPVVSDLIGRARLVILVAGPGPGTLWEFTEAVRLLPPSRLVLLVLAEPRPSLIDPPPSYEAFREALPAAFAARGEDLAPPVLPDCPPPARPKKLTWEPGLHAVVRFCGEGSAEYSRLDPTAVRALTYQGVARGIHRRQLRPLLREIENSLPSAAEEERRPV